MLDTTRLDSVIDRMWSLCKAARSADSYHLEPDAVSGGTRDWVYTCMDWIGVPRDTVPYNHIFIHSRLDVPAKIELSTEYSDEHRQAHSVLSLYISHELHISLKGVVAAIAHECAHLHLFRQGKQSLEGTNSLEDEYETDVASIVLGLGKVVLNGVCDYTEKKPAERIGYLSAPDLGYVYTKVGVKLGLTQSVLREGLIPNAIGVLK